MQRIKAPLTLLSIATLIAVAGCGSSSSSDDSGHTPDPTPDPDENTQEQIQVLGEAVKGVLKHAQVTAYELNDQGERLGGAVGSAQTDENGEYSVDLTEEYTGGLLEIEVTATENTTMVCDARRCGDGTQGDDIPVPQDFSLRTIAEKSADSNSVSAAVTAWTTMAANRAQALLASGGSTTMRDARRQASSEVSQVVGFDIGSARARGVSQLDGASDDEAQYALMNAAVAEIIFRDNGASLSEQLNQFTAALNDGTLGDADDGFSTADLAQAINSALSANADRVNDTVSDRLANQSARIESGGSDGFKPGYDDDLIVDEDATDAEKIAAYQTFMTQARTWLSSMGELTADEVTQAVNIDQDTLRATVDADTQVRFQYLGEVAGQVAAHATANVATLVEKLENGGTETISIRDSQGQEAGRAELTFADHDGLSITAKGWSTDSSGAVFEPFELSIDTNIPVSDLTIDRDGNTITGARLARILANTQLRVNAHIGDLSGSHYVSLSDAELNIQLDSNLTSNSQGEFDTEATEAVFLGATFSGTAAINSNGYRFDGNVAMELTRLNSQARLYVGTELQGSVLAPKSARLNGEFVSADGAIRFNASASVNLHNAAAFDTFGWYANRGRWLWFSDWLESDESEKLFKELVSLEGSYYSYVSLNYYPGYYESSTFWETAYRENPERVRSFYGMSLTREEVDAIGRKALAHLFSEEDFRVRYYSNELSDIVETTISGSVLSAEAYNFGGNIYNSSSGWSDLLMFYIPEHLLVDFPDHGSFWDDNYEVFFDRLNGYYEIGVYRLGESGSLLSELTDVVDYDFLEVGELTGINLYRKSFDFNVSGTESAFSLCLENPELVIESWIINEEWFDLRAECAWMFLEQEYIERELTENELSLLEETVTRYVENRLPGRVPYDFESLSFAISSPGSAGSWYATIELTDPQTPDYYLQGSITASLGIQLPELPEAQLTATFNRSAYADASLRTHIDWDGGSYSLDIAAQDLDNPESIDLRFYNAQGYELLITAHFADGALDDITGQALINDEQVGEVQWRDGRPMLVYADGEEYVIESLY